MLKKQMFKYTRVYIYFFKQSINLPIGVEEYDFRRNYTTQLIYFFVTNRRKKKLLFLFSALVVLLFYCIYIKYYIYINVLFLS